MWKKAMDYLGLGPDESYDDYDADHDAAPRRERPRERDRGYEREREREYPRDRGEYRDHEPARRQPQQPSQRWSEPEEASRPAPRPSFPQRDPDVVVRRPAPAPDDSSVQPRPVNQPVPMQRGAGATAEPHSVRPRRFDSAQEVADHFKDGVPVIMNLEGCDRDVARRLIDFASGLCYGLGGSMEKVASGVYLLKPSGSRHDH